MCGSRRGVRGCLALAVRLWFLWGWVGGVGMLVGLGDRSAGGAFGVAPGDLGAAEFLVGRVVRGHVPDRGDDRVLDGGQCPPWAAAGGQPLAAGGEVGVLGSDRAERGEVTVAARVPSGLQGVADGFP